MSQQASLDGRRALQTPWASPPGSCGLRSRRAHGPVTTEAPEERPRASWALSLQGCCIDSPRAMLSPGYWGAGGVVHPSRGLRRP